MGHEHDFCQAEKAENTDPVRIICGKICYCSWPPKNHRGRKKHINFFNMNCLAPTQNTPLGAPRKKFMCLISWERTQKRDPHKLYRGDLGGQKGVPNGPFSATKSLVYCVSPALTHRVLRSPFRGLCVQGAQDSTSIC